MTTLPEVHSSSYVPPEDPGRDATHDQIPGSAAPGIVPARRGWRAAPTLSGDAPGPATDGGLPLQAHLDSVGVDPRHDRAGDVLPGADSGAWAYSLSPTSAAAGQPAPVRGRGGSITGDESRRSWRNLWTYIRPWDKIAADDFAGTGTRPVIAPVPHAYLAPAPASGVPGALPSGTAAGPAVPMNPTGVVLPTTRILPGSWSANSETVDDGTLSTGGGDALRRLGLR